MAVIGIHYGGGNEYDENDKIIEHPIDYKHVYLHLSNDKEILFESGNFVKDWFHAKKKFLEIHEEEMHLSASSSVDQFIMDGAPYDSAYLVFKDGGDVGELTYEYDDEGWEMFVEKGTKPTWDELKKFCKNE